MLKKSKLTALLLSVVLLLAMFPVSPLAAEKAASTTDALLDFSSQLNGLVEEYDTPYFEETKLSAEKTTALGEILSEGGTGFENALSAVDGELNGQNPSDSSASKPQKAFSKARLQKEKKKAEAAKAIVSESALAEGFEVKSAGDGSLVVSKPFQTKRIVVKANKKPTDSNAVAVVGGYNGIYVLQYKTEQDAAAALSELSGRGDITFAQADGVVSCNEYLSWGYGESYMNQSNYITWLNDAKPTREKVTVAVIDSGVAYNHEFLKGRVDTENDYDFVDNDNDADDAHNHGTHVAGTIAEGTGSNVTILPIRSLDAAGFGTDMQIYLGLCYAIEKNADVINMSLGAEGRSYLVEEAIDEADEKGIIVCVAAGNRSEDASNHYPANVESAITVAAVDKDMKLASFSNYGACVDIAAPGVGINSSVPYESETSVIKYEEMNGTSMATPHVAAACAELKSFNKKITAADALNYFSETALEVQTDKGAGAGFVCMTDILSGDASKLSISDASLSMFPGGEYLLKSMTIPQSGVTWSSSDESVASVEGGAVTAKKIGSCEIIAQANGQTRKCRVNVSALSLSLSADSLTLYDGLETYVTYAVSHRKTVELYSSDENVFKVSKNGMVTATGVGQATLTAVAGKGTKSETETSIPVRVVDVGAWYDDSATEYVIENAEQLYELSVMSYRGRNFEGKTVKISDDVEKIDISCYPDWLPIGIKTFKGTFDGNNKPIVGMKTTDEENIFNVALFGIVKGGEVKNVVLSDVSVRAANGAAGIAVIASDAKIENCRVDGTIVCEGQAAGIVCEMGSSSVVNCENRAYVESKANVGGGIVSMSLSGGTVVNCINYGDINPYLGGGVVGAANSTGFFVLERDLATDGAPVSGGNVASDNSLKDIVLSPGRNAIVNCVNVGNAKRGIVGKAEGSNLLNCYYLEGASVSAYRVCNSFASSDGYVFKEPSVYSFGAELIGKNKAAVISSLNSLVYGINDSDGDIELYAWNVENGLPSLGHSTQTDNCALWLSDYGNQLLYTAESRKVSVLSNTAVPPISWSSSDESVASVSSDGTVTAISAGNAVITAFCEQEKISLSYTVGVVEIGPWYTNSEDNYCISDGRQFYEFSRIVNFGIDDFKGKYVYLKNDIDLSAYENWVPVGYADAKAIFAGTFDGKNNTIRNMNIESEAYPVGLFGTIAAGAVLENIVLDRFNVKYNKGYSNAALCARINEGSVVRNCVTEAGRIRSGKSPNAEVEITGVFVGNNNRGLIENCINNATCIAVSSNIAGICGKGTGDVINCVNNGYIYGSWFVSGIYGKPENCYGDYFEIIHKPVIANCTNNGTIQLETAISGEAAGISGSPYGEILNSVNNGEILASEKSDNAKVFGIISDDMTGMGFLIDNVVNEGSVVGGKHNYAIGPVLETRLLKAYYLETSAKEAAIFSDEVEKQLLHPYSADRTLKNGESLLDVLNSNVDEHNKTNPKVKYSHWFVDSDNRLRIGEACPHTRTGYVNLKYADCTNDGERRLQCFGCGKRFSEIEVIKAYGHTVPDEYTVTEEPTCTKWGYRYKRCTVCDCYLEETYESLGFLPHKPGDWIIDKEPTCVKSGKRHRVCSVCHDNVNIETIPAKGHVCGDWITVKEATCTSDGLERMVCLVCNETLETRKLEKGHRGEWIEDVPHSCTTDGVKHRICTLCGETETLVTPAGHIRGKLVCVKEETCGEEGYYVCYCSVCNEIIETRRVGGLNHLDSDGDGICEYCGKKIDSGHDGTSCNHICHKSGISGLIWKIVNIFNKLFRVNRQCSCGKQHY